MKQKDLEKYTKKINIKKFKLLKLKCEKKDFLKSEYNLDKYIFKNKSKIFIELNNIFINEIVPDIIGYQISKHEEETKLLLEKWNNYSLENKNFAKHNYKSKYFNKICLVVSWRIHKHNLNSDSLFKILENFWSLPEILPKLKYSKKIQILDFLCGIASSKKNKQKIFYFDIALKGLSIANMLILKEAPKYPKSFERLQLAYSHFFYENREKQAQEEIVANWYKFVSFSNGLVEDHKSREMCGLSIQQYIYRLVKFLHEKFATFKFTTINALFNDKQKINFANYIRKTEGWEHFYEKK